VFENSLSPGLKFANFWVFLKFVKIRLKFGEIVWATSEVSVCSAVRTKTGRFSNSGRTLLAVSGFL
jgi:hypothetical protein